MTNQEILEKAIEKAIADGWDKFGKKTADWRVLDNEADNTFPGYEIKFMNKKHHWFCTSSDIIFNHDFAKALWPSDKTISHGNWDDMRTMTEEIIPAWSYHLQQMVVADDPIKYLGENL